VWIGNQGRKQLAALGGVGLIGIEMGVSVAVGYLGGSWLDSKFGTDPWLSAVGLVLGIIAGFRSLYRLTQREQRRLDQEKARELAELAPPEEPPRNDPPPP
jgi:ATP synthase protein I